MSFPSASVQSEAQPTPSQKIAIVFKGMHLGTLDVCRVPNPYPKDTRSPVLYRINYQKSDETLQKCLAEAVVTFLNGDTPRTRRLATGSIDRVTTESVQQHLKVDPLFVVDPQEGKNVSVCYMPHGAGFPYASRRRSLYCVPPLGLISSIR